MRSSAAGPSALPACPARARLCPRVRSARTWTLGSALALGWILVLLPAPVPALSWAGGVQPSAEQLASVQDSFDWADGIITALGALAPPLPPSPSPAQGWNRGRGHFHRRRAVVLPRPALVPRFVGRHLRLRRSTVFGTFDLTVTETSPHSFDVIVGSDEPAEDIQVRNGRNQAVLVERALDDERVFRVHVPAALGPDIVLSVSLDQDGGIDRAYFPLLGGTAR